MSNIQAQFAMLLPDQRACMDICVEASSEMIIGLRGIFRAGNLYVSLDQAYPRERLEASAQRPDLSPALGSYHA